VGVAAALSPLGLLTGVGIFVAAAAVVDARSGRIPNDVVVTIGVVTAARAIALVVTGASSAGAVVAAVAAGVMLSGSVTLFAVWLNRPAAVGGGD
jgi:Flp pilus assembly protein protease CpaA